MRGRLFTIVAAVSLACAVALAGLWVRSHFFQDWFYYGRAGTYVGVGSNFGTLAFVRMTGYGSHDGLSWQTPQALQGVSSVTSAANLPGGWGRVFFRFGMGGWRGPASAGFALEVPHWSAIILFLIPPALWWRRRRRRPARGFFVETATVTNDSVP